MSLFTLIYFLYSIFLSQVLNYIYIFVLLLVCLPAPNLSTFSLAKLSYLAEYLINRNASRPSKGKVKNQKKRRTERERQGERDA